MKKLSLVSVFFFVFAASLQAQFKASYFSRDTQWILHADLKALNQSSMGHFLQRSLDDQVLRRLAALKAVSGIDLTNDVDAVAVCGKGNAEAGGIVYASGRFDVAKLSTIIGGAEAFQSQPFGKHTLLSWTDKGKRVYLSFAGSKMVVLSMSEPLLRETLNLIDGKSPRLGLAADAPAAGLLAHREGRFLTLQADNLSSLASTNNLPWQILAQAQALHLEVSQMSGANGLDCTLTLFAPNRETAQQMQQTAVGLQALFMMQAAKNPEAATAAQQVKVAVDDVRVSLTLQVPEALLLKVLQNRRAPAQQGVAAGKQPPRKAAQNAF